MDTKSGLPPSRPLPQKPPRSACARCWMESFTSSRSQVRRHASFDRAGAAVAWILRWYAADDPVGQFHAKQRWGATL